MAISAALYREILRQIEREGYGSRPGRAVVPAWQERLLIARHRLKRRRAPDSPGLRVGPGEGGRSLAL
jgi:15-cis-phytoene synthase